MENMTDEGDSDGYRDSLFNRDEEDFSGMGKAGGTGSSQHAGFYR
jgi:hypothetical protein